MLLQESRKISNATSKETHTSFAMNQRQKHDEKRKTKRQQTNNQNPSITSNKN